MHCAAILERVLQSELMFFGHRPKRFRKCGKVLATKPRAPTSMVTVSAVQLRTLEALVMSQYGHVSSAVMRMQLQSLPLPGQFSRNGSAVMVVQP